MAVIRCRLERLLAATVISITLSGQEVIGWSIVSPRRSPIRQKHDNSLQNDDTDAALRHHTSAQLSRSAFISASIAGIAAISCPESTHASSLNHNTHKYTKETNTPDFPAITTVISKDEEKNQQVWEETLSGLIAGASLSGTKTLVKYPLDTATVRLQMPNTPYSIRNMGALLDGSLRGVTVPLLSNIPGGAIFFAVRDACKAELRDTGLSRFAVTSISVFVANWPYWFWRNPTEVVKTRQQAGVEGYGEDVSTLEAFKKVFEESRAAGNSTGLEGFYSGYLENIIYAYPADVIKFLSYDVFSGGKKNLSAGESAVAGALATGVAQFLTTPLDVVRNRVMAGKKDSISGQQETDDGKSSYFESLATLAKQEGLQGLFAGAAPRVGKALVSGAVQFVTYEETKQKIGNFLNRRQ